MNLRELRDSLNQIGTGHNEKPVAVIVSGKVFYLEAVIAVQGDRILIDAATPRGTAPSAHRHPLTEATATVFHPMFEIIGRKVIVSRDGIAAFNRIWPGSSLRATRAYWFEFDARRDLVDTDCPEQDDGPAASAMADDCKAYLFDDVTPAWAGA